MGGVRRWSVARGFAVWLGLSAVGAVVVALPDAGPRVVSFTEGHGPSALDTGGIVLLLAGWLAYVVPLWKSRSAIRHQALLATLAVAGGAVVGWSVMTDTGAWWMLGVVALWVAHVAAGIPAMRRGTAPDHDRPPTSPRARVGP